MAMDQFTISLPPDLRTRVVQLAEQENRTASGQIRHWIVEALRRANGVDHSPPPKSPWPVRLPTKLDTAEEKAAAKDHLAALERERNRLDAIRAPYLMPEQATRLAFLHNEIAVLSGEIWRRERTENTA
jgi:predicted transcriptional regulator